MANKTSSNHYSTSKDRDTHHVAVFAFPFSTHGTPLLNITRRLAYLATPNHNIHFSFFSTPQSLRSLFPGCSKTDKDFPNIRSYEIWDGKPQGYVTTGNPTEEIDLFFKAATGKGALMKAVAEAEAEVGEKVKVVMGDAFLWFLRDLAHELRVPWISCWVSGEHALSIHAYTDLLRQKFGIQGIEGREEETLDFIPGMSKIRIKDVQGGVVADIDSTFANILHQMTKVLPLATAVCITSCEELDPTVIKDLKTQYAKVLSIGPLNLIVDPPEVPDTHNCLGWLDKQEANSVVYVSFGSAATPTPAELVALAEALQTGGHKFVWSLKDHSKVHLPNGFLERNGEKGMIVPWVPQIKVLAHNAVGVFITHFGYNSMTESIAAEVPMIGRPFFGDHSVNGRLIEEVWQIGLQVKGGVFTKDGVLESLNRIVKTDEGTKMKANIKNLHELLQKATVPDGSSNKNFDKLLELLTSS